MLQDTGQRLLGNTLYTIGDIYTIKYACNHYENIITSRALFPNTKVQFLDKVSKTAGVFARVKNIHTDEVYDINYTNLGA